MRAENGVLVIASSAFAQDELDSALWTADWDKLPREDFYFDYTAGGQNVLMTPKRGYWDGNTQVMEFAPAWWIRYEGYRSKIRIQFRRIHEKVAV